MPSSHSTRRENAGRSLSPRFSLRCKTIARSLIFAPRRRLPPPLLSARHFSLKTRGIAAGFLHLCLPLTLRVAKMQDVLSLLVPAELSLILSFLLRGGGFRRRYFPQGNFRSKPTVSPWVSCIYAFLSLYASRKCRTFFRSSFLRNYRSLYPTKNPADFTRGPRFIPHEKSCGFYAGTPVLLIIVCKNRDIWMKFCPTENAFGGDPKTRKAPADRQERTIYRTWMFSPQALDKAIRQYTPQNMRFAGTPDFCPTKNPADFTRGPRIARLETPSFG